MVIGQNWGGNKPPDSVAVLLPFPPEKGIFTDGKVFKVSKATATTFFQLIAAGKLPMWAAADLVRYAPQWKELLAR
jgi:hypothetical protein